MKRAQLREKYPMLTYGPRGRRVAVHYDVANGLLIPACHSDAQRLGFDRVDPDPGVLAVRRELEARASDAAEAAGHARPAAWYWEIPKRRRAPSYSGVRVTVVLPPSLIAFVRDQAHLAGCTESEAYRRLLTGARRESVSVVDRVVCVNCLGNWHLTEIRRGRCPNPNCDEDITPVRPVRPPPTLDGL